MTTNNSTNPKQFWYNEPIAWLLIGIITLTICWVSLSLTIAILKQDSVVIDDYYKNGKAINQDFSQDNNASSAMITADITIHSDSLQIIAKVKSNISQWPVRLYLSLSSSAFPEQDQDTILIKQLNSTQKDENHMAFYIGHFQKYPKGVFYVQLSTNTSSSTLPNENEPNPFSWRLKEKISINDNKPIFLSYD